MNAGGVVEENRAGLGIVEFELGEHDGHAAVRELIEHGFFFTESHDGNAVDFALQACGGRMRPARQDRCWWS